jgi:hypothetical protein
MDIYLDWLDFAYTDAEHRTPLHCAECGLIMKAIGIYTLTCNNGHERELLGVNEKMIS